MTEAVKLRWQGKKSGFERITIKKGILRCYFVPVTREDYYKSETFSNILKYAQMHPRQCRMKEIKGKPMLIIEDVNSIASALETLRGI